MPSSFIGDPESPGVTGSGANPPFPTLTIAAPRADGQSRGGIRHDGHCGRIRSLRARGARTERAWIAAVSPKRTAVRRRHSFDCVRRL